MTSAIHVSHFSQAFGSKTVIDDVSFSVDRGEIFAYLGTNGSGKTTTIRSLLRIYTPSAGDLEILGTPFDSSLYGRIGYLPEERGLYTSENVGDVLLYFAELRGVERARAQQSIDSYLERVGLADKKYAKIKTLSSGQQQKIQFGVATIHAPEILILDEPMKGLDPVNRQLFIDMILAERDRGATILFSSHQMEDVEKMSNSLLILKNGRVAAHGKVEDIRKQYGRNTIKVSFEGKFPKNDDLYSANVSNTYAELTPNTGIDEQKILSFFIEKGLRIFRYELSLPSLNDIFIQINSD